MIFIKTETDTRRTVGSVSLWFISTVGWYLWRRLFIRLSLFDTGAWKQKWGEEHRPLLDPGLFLLWLFSQSLFLITGGQVRVISKSTVSWRCDKLSNYVVPLCALLYFLKLCIGQICDSDSVILKFWKYINNDSAYKEIPASCDKEASQEASVWLEEEEVKQIYTRVWKHTFTILPIHCIFLFSQTIHCHL